MRGEFLMLGMRRWNPWAFYFVSAITEAKNAIRKTATFRL
jgi:hypothetical protein